MKHVYTPFLLSVLLILTNCISPKTNESAISEEIEIKEVPLTIYVFEVGEILIKDLAMFNPGVDEGKQATFTNTAYLIKHPKGMLIWDTGLPDALADIPEGNDSPNFLMKMPKRLVDQLTAIDVDPENIEYAAVSHEHGDHIGNLALFRNATLLLQEEEYLSLFENKDRLASELDSLKSNAYIKLMGDHDVFGDGKVIIKRAIGHTAGHQMLFVDLPETGPVLLSGDLYHFAKNRENRGVPSFNWDKEQTLASMDLMEQFLKDKNASLWIQHDMHSAQVKWAPEYYR